MFSLIWAILWRFCHYTVFCSPQNIKCNMSIVNSIHLCCSQDKMRVLGCLICHQMDKSHRDCQRQIWQWYLHYCCYLANVETLACSRLSTSWMFSPLSLEPLLQRSSPEAAEYHVRSMIIPTNSYLLLMAHLL